MRCGRHVQLDHSERPSRSDASSGVEAAKARLVDGFQTFFEQLQKRAGFDDALEGPEDKLDDQEQFDKMEMERIVSSDPDALAFFQAQKTRRSSV